jgi:hypothetical protein
MKFKIKFLILILLGFSIMSYSQVNEEDVASWGLKVLSSELNKKGKYGTADAIYGLSKLFDISSERRFQKDLARIMTSMNLPDGIYAIKGGNIATVPNGYLKQEGHWNSLDEYNNGELTMIVNGKLYDVPESWLMFYANNEWFKIDKNNISDEQGLIIKEGELHKLNDGWYCENGEWKNINQLKIMAQDNSELFKYEPHEPYGLFFYSTWNDTNNNRIKEKSELEGYNKPVYNIAKENMSIDLNIPDLSDNIVFISLKNDQIIGTSVCNIKEKKGFYFIGPKGNPSVSMDFMDRIAFDVRKNGAGTYKIIATTTDKNFDQFERTVKVIYQQ